MVALVLEQVLRAVEHLHSLDIGHGNLKPSNILFVRMEENVHVKVVGFGRANGEPKWKRHLNKQFGNILFMAPEAVHGCYGKEMDLWSVGALMYAMFVGYAPFEEANDGQVFKQEISRIVMSRLGRREINRNVIRRMEQGFKGLPDGVSISREARDLLHSLLTTKTAKRSTVHQALKHSWFDAASYAQKIPTKSLQQLMQNCSMDKFMASVVSEFCEKADFSVMTQLNNYFQKFEDNENRVSLLRFEGGLNLFCPEVGVRDIRQHIVADSNSFIQFDEFRSLVAYQQLSSMCYRQKPIFEGFESNRDDFLMSADVMKLMRVISEDPLSKRFEIATADVIKNLVIDGQVNFDEFLLVMHSEILKAQMKVLKLKILSQNQRVQLKKRSIKPAFKIIQRANSVDFRQLSNPQIGQTMCQRSVKEGFKVLRRGNSIDFLDENCEFRQEQSVLYSFC